MMIGSHYRVRAQRKVGRQNIGEMLGLAYTFGEKKDVLAKMQAKFPGARVSANAYLFDRQDHLEAFDRAHYPNAKRVVL